MDQKIIKTSGPEYVHGPSRGFCYDGMGLNDCSFWQHGKNSPDGKSRCMLFGGGIEKNGSESLRICDRIFGIDFTGEI